MRCEVRIRMRPDRYDGRAGEWLMQPQPIVLVDSAAWVMVRSADYPNGTPFVISRKEWDKLEVQT